MDPPKAAFDDCPQRYSLEGMMLTILHGSGIFDRTHSDIIDKNPSFNFMSSDIRTAVNLGFNARSLLESGVQFSSVHAQAVQVIAQEAARVAREQLQIIADRAESVSLLASRLGTSEADLAAFTQTEAALTGFTESALAATTGLSVTQFTQQGMVYSLHQDTPQ